MAAGPETARINRRVAFPWVLLGAILCPAAHAQLRLTLEQVTRRKPPDFTPLYAGQKVIVQGVVSAHALSFPDHVVLPLEQAGYGAVLEAAGSGIQVTGYQPGDELEVTGKVSAPAGMVVIAPSEIHNLGRRPPPAVHEIPPDQLMDFSRLGLLVRTEGRINEIGETTAGSFLQLSTRKGNYRIFLPHGPGTPGAVLTQFNLGDRVAATGIANQYCVAPPYNRWFELLVADPSLLLRTERSWLVPPLAAACALLGVLALGFLLWVRERRMEVQRERLRRVYQLGEEIMGAASIPAILVRISQSLPTILGITGVRLYVYNRGTKALDSIPAEGQPPLSLSLSAPPGGTQAGAVACFHYRTLLVIPDIDRSPFPITPIPGQSRPRSLLFVPMMSQGEMVGVLELDQDDRARDFTADEQTLAQHLGNQIGVAIRLLDQRSVQEQLFRTEKLAAVGRLISGVVNELQAPLSSIVELANRAVLQLRSREAATIATEAQKASVIVSRLVSFAAAEQGAAQPVCISILLRNLIEFREREWKASGIRVQDLTSADPLYVLGSHGQLEQAFLTLFVHAEQALAGSSEKTILIRTSILGKKVLVEIAFTAPPDAHPPQETAMLLGVTRSVIAGHGGEVRLMDKPPAAARFEVELPLIQRERTPVAGALPAAAVTTSGNRHLTALVIEPEEPVQRQLLGLLVARGYRVVPVGDADMGLELAQRMRFDLAFCSVHAPGLNWVELSERLHSRVGGFILLADRYDPEFFADIESEGRCAMAKPVQDADLERVLHALDSSFTVKEA
jgi:GAF domain-containing protein/CheY-like chemotaxis protein